jgi:hypothetical protein
VTIKEIFEILQSRGLAISQVQFSSIWLNRSPRYYSQLIATGREPSVGALVGLANRIGRIAGSMPLDRAQPLLDLKQQLDRYCERREIVGIRRRKRRAA